MICLSSTLLPLPLGPITTKISPRLNRELDSFEDLLPAVAFAKPAHLHADAVFASLSCGAHYKYMRSARVRK